MNVPKLRFKEFDGEWEEKDFEELLEAKDGIRRGPFGSALKKEFFVPESDYVVYEQQNAIYDKYTTRYNITKDKYEELNKFSLKPGDFIMSGAGTIGRISKVPKGIKKGVFNQALIRFRINSEITDSEYFLQFMRAEKMQRKLTGANPGSAITNLVPMSELKKWSIITPNIKEQQKISKFLKAVDKRIQLQQQKIDLLQEQKKGYMQKVFKQELRFTDNNGKAYFEWKYIKLGALTNKTGKKNKDGFKYPVASVNNKTGCRINGEKNNSNADVDISAYKIVYKDEFVYNPSRINVGSYGYQNLVEKAIVSSLYVVFETKEELLNEYLKIYMDTVYFNNEVRRNTEGSVREYLFYENFSNIKIPLPSIEEQKKIADFLGRLDNKINLEEAKLKGLQKQKQGFMQQMFI